MSRFTTGDGVELSFSTHGDQGQVVILIHGWACTSVDWAWTIGGLVADHRVVTLDIRGHGGSSAPVKDLSAGRFALDIIELMDHLACDQAVLVGHSLGGVIASEVAVGWPDRVRGVVVVDPAYGLASNAMPVVGLPDMLRGDGGYDVLLAVFGQLEGPDTPPALRTLHGLHAIATHPHVVSETIAAMIDEQGWFGPSAAWLSRRTCPVLAFYRAVEHGEWDRQTFQHKHSAVEVCPGVGHWLHQEDPQRFARVLAPWIAGLA